MRQLRWHNQILIELFKNYLTLFGPLEVLTSLQSYEEQQAYITDLKEEMTQSHNLIG